MGRHYANTAKTLVSDACKQKEIMWMAGLNCAVTPNIADERRRKKDARGAVDSWSAAGLELRDGVVADMGLDEGGAIFVEHLNGTCTPLPQQRDLWRRRAARKRLDEETEARRRWMSVRLVERQLEEEEEARAVAAAEAETRKIAAAAAAAAEKQRRTDAKAAAAAAANKAAAEAAALAAAEKELKAAAEAAAIEEARRVAAAIEAAERIEAARKTEAARKAAKKAEAKRAKLEASQKAVAERKKMAQKQAIGEEKAVAARRAEIVRKAEATRVAEVEVVTAVGREVPAATASKQTHKEKRLEEEEGKEVTVAEEDTEKKRKKKKKKKKKKSQVLKNDQKSKGSIFVDPYEEEDNKSWATEMDGDWQVGHDAPSKEAATSKSKQAKPHVTPNKETDTGVTMQSVYQADFRGQPVASLHERVRLVLKVQPTPYEKGPGFDREAAWAFFASSECCSMDLLFVFPFVKPELYAHSFSGYEACNTARNSEKGGKEQEKVTDQALGHKETEIVRNRAPIDGNRKIGMKPSQNMGETKKPTRRRKSREKERNKAAPIAAAQVSESQRSSPAFIEPRGEEESRNGLDRAESEVQALKGADRKRKNDHHEAASKASMEGGDDDAAKPRQKKEKKQVKKKKKKSRTKATAVDVAAVREMEERLKLMERMMKQQAAELERLRARAGGGDEDTDDDDNDDDEIEDE